MARAITSITGGLLLIASIAGCASQRPRFDPDDPVKYANAWQPGWPIPRELLRYRNDSEWFHGGHIYHTDSHQVYSDVENYLFLWAIVVHPDTDQRVFLVAAEQALLMGGPRRFFNDLRAFAARERSRAKEPRFRAVLQRDAE